MSELREENHPQAILSILSRSRAAYESFTSPLGLGFIVFGGYAGTGACATVNGRFVKNPEDSSDVGLNPLVLVTSL